MYVLVHHRLRMRMYVREWLEYCESIHIISICEWCCRLSLSHWLDFTLLLRLMSTIRRYWASDHHALAFLSHMCTLSHSTFLYVKTRLVWYAALCAESGRAFSCFRLGLSRLRVICLILCVCVYSCKIDNDILSPSYVHIRTWVQVVALL